MKPQNAQATLSSRAAGVFSAEGRGMASAADALSTDNAIAGGTIRTSVAANMARRRFAAPAARPENFQCPCAC